MAVTRRVVVAGGGYAGLTAARRLLRSRDLEVTVVNPTGYMTYQPLLPEVAAGTVQPAHVTVPLRTALPRAEVLTGSVVGLDLPGRTVEVATADGSRHRVPYDDLVLALGAVTRVPPVPGLTEHAIGFRTVEEALHLGNRVLSRLEVAASTTSAERRRRALTFVFVGGGYAGVEALGEVHDLVRRTIGRFPALTMADTRWLLVEAAPRILGPLPERLAAYTTRHLAGRGIEVRTGTTVAAVERGLVLLGDGTTVATDTVVWTAGVVPHPVLRRLGLPCDAAGRVVADAGLRVAPHVWAVGDCAAVTDVHTGRPCPPTAQHAVRQATLVADNVRHSRGRPYRHRDAGAVASLGLGKGVAELYGVPLRGPAAWLVHRLYHGSRLPCRRRRLLVTLLWLLGAGGRDAVAMPALEAPHRPLRQAREDQLVP